MGRIILFSLLALFLVACSDEDPDAKLLAGQTNRVMATVNGVPIMSEKLDMIFLNWGEEYERQHGPVTYELIKNERTKILEQLINQEVIRQRLKESGITASEEEIKAGVSRIIDELGGSDAFLNFLQEKGYVTFEQFESEVKEDLMAQKAFVKDMRLEEPTEKDLLAFYQKYLSAMVIPERIWLSHIQVSLDPKDLPDHSKTNVFAEEYLHYIKDQIDNHYTTFAKAARDYSECRSAQHGGSVGELRYGDFLTMPKIIHDTAFKLALSNTSEVVVSPLGAHLLYVTRREKAYTNSFDQAKEVIKAYLNRDILEQNRDKWILFLRNRANIHYNETP